MIAAYANANPPMEDMLTLLLLADVHLSPWITVPLAVIIAIGLILYWLRLGGDEVPGSRRVIRRISVVTMLIALPVLVRALSYLDPVADERSWAIGWTVAVLLLLVVIIVAVVDVANSLRLHAHHHDELALTAAEELAKALQHRQDELRSLGSRTTEIDRNGGHRESPAATDEHDEPGEGHR